MAYRPFIGRTQAWLEAELAKAQEDLASGKTTTGWGAGDRNASKKSEASAAKRIQLLRFELYHLNPTAYPKASVQRVTRTKAVFSDNPRDTETIV